MKSYTLKIDLNALNHLGLNLYSNVPAVLSELIANAWDADSTEVSIDTTNNQIAIADNGCGMSSTDLQDKFLTVGYQRRTEEASDSTPLYERKVMGRKGIGKLSVFSIAGLVQVYTKQEQDNELLGIELDVNDIQKSISNKEEYKPKLINSDHHEWEEYLPKSGTVIVLKKLKKRILSSLDTHLKARISRRFDIWDASAFCVTVNREPVTIEDRNYFNKLEFVTIYGDYSKERFQQIDESLIVCREDDMGLQGWIGLVKESGSLQDEQGNINKISILSRGKVAREDILDSFRDGGLYTKYLIGEIRADFLDETEKEDIALSNRQDFIRDDKRIILLEEFIKNELSFIRQERVKYKERQGVQKAEEIPAIKNWFQSLRGDQKSAAKKLFGKINTIATDEDHQKTLYKHGILAFEHLHHKEKLQQLEQLSIDNLETVVNLFSELDDIEATWYYEITQGRLEIINNLIGKVDKDALEKIIQEHIYNHLWLLDPSWDRATEIPRVEETVVREFEKISEQLSDAEKRGRVDIRYKKTTGKHVIIELKRASVKVDKGRLSDQVNKYKNALRKQLAKLREEGSIECICLLGELPNGWDNPDARKEGESSLAAEQIRVVTYEQLISDAQKMYQSYLDKRKDKGRLIKLLEEIDK